MLAEAPELAPESRPASDAEPCLHGLVLLSVLHCRPDEEGADRRGFGDRLCTGGRLVCVLEIAVLGLLRGFELGRLRRRDLRMEEGEDDLFADALTELLEHEVPFVAVLHERVLLRERAQVD